MPSTRKLFIKCKARISLCHRVPRKPMFSTSILKEHRSGIEPRTIGCRARSPSIGPLQLFLHLRSSLMLYPRVKNFKSKRIIAYAFHSQIVKQGFPYAIGYRVNQCSSTQKKDTYRGSNPAPLASESRALPLCHCPSS